MAPNDDKPQDPLNAPEDGDRTDQPDFNFDMPEADADKAASGGEDVSFAPVEGESADVELPASDAQPEPDETLDFAAVSAEQAAEESAEPGEPQDGEAPVVQTEETVEEEETWDFEGLGAAPSAGEDAPSGDQDDSEEIESDEEDAEPKPSIWERITSVDPYSVLLGISFLVITLAVISLFMEWAAYDFDTSAQQAKTLVP